MTTAKKTAIGAVATTAVVSAVLFTLDTPTPGPAGGLSYEGAPAIRIEIDPEYPVMTFEDSLGNTAMRYLQDTNVYGNWILFVPGEETTPPNNAGFIKMRKSNSAIEAQLNNQHD